MESKVKSQKRKSDSDEDMPPKKPVCRFTLYACNSHCWTPKKDFWLVIKRLKLLHNLHLFALSTGTARFVLSQIWLRRETFSTGVANERRFTSVSRSFVIQFSTLIEKSFVTPITLQLGCPPWNCFKMSNQDSQLRKRSYSKHSLNQKFL